MCAAMPRSGILLTLEGLSRRAILAPEQERLEPRPTITPSPTQPGSIGGPVRGQ